MIPELTSITLQGLDLPESAVQGGIQINKKMCCYIKTTDRVSSECYYHTEELDKYSKCQGKTSSLPNWKILSSSLVTTLHALCAGLCRISTCDKYIAKQAI
eukprot:8343529-Ditylum_brightwellii.AAC.1